MATCDTQELSVEASCFTCLTPQQLLAVQAAILCRINQTLDPMATCNKDELMEEASCFACMEMNQQLAIIAQLLCNVSESLGGRCGNGNPNILGLVGAFCGQNYLDVDDNTTYTWNSEIPPSGFWV